MDCPFLDGSTQSLPAPASVPVEASLLSLADALRPQRRQYSTPRLGHGVSLNPICSACFFLAQTLRCIHPVLPDHVNKPLVAFTAAPSSGVGTALDCAVSSDLTRGVPGTPWT